MAQNLQRGAAALAKHVATYNKEHMQQFQAHGSMLWPHWKSSRRISDSVHSNEKIWTADAVDASAVDEIQRVYVAWMVVV